MPAWALKLSAVFITLFMLFGSYDYASGHIKNANAPLQPPVADKPAVSAPPSPTPTATVGPLFTTRPGQRPPSTSPAPRLTINPGVQTASLAPLTFTHSS